MRSKSSGIGSFCLARNRKPGGGFYPNWNVQFRLPDNIRVRESSKLPICARCLAEEDALRSRPKCGCIEEVKAWAAVRLEELVREWKGNRLKPAGERDADAPAVKTLTLGEVAKVYRERGPDEREVNLRSLELVVNAGLGRFDAAVWESRLDELHPDMWDEFAWCYQEYERRGWTRRGNPEVTQRVPADAWRQIRAVMPRNPDPDRECATPGNTTIVSHMRKAKSVLGPESRDSYLKPLRDRFPECLRKWWETKISIRTPDNRFSLKADVYAAMWEGLALLKQDDPEVWALIRLHWTTGVRPIEARHAQVTWLEQDAAGCVLLVVKNRFEDDQVVDGVLVKGFRMKDPTTRQERAWPLPVDLVEMLPRIASEGGSLLGCDTDYQWEKIYRRANAWLRGMGMEGAQTLYNLRKLVATVKLANEGGDAAAAALGHSDSRTTLDFYAGTSQPIKALSDEDLSPERVMGARRMPWVMTKAA